MRYLMTQSLLSSWLYQYSDFSKYKEKEDEYRQKAHDEFILTLKRVRTPTTEAQQNGIDFEDLAVKLSRLDMAEREQYNGHKWFSAACRVADEITGGQFQVALHKEVTVDDVELLLYGRLDCLVAGKVKDIKYTGKYVAGKFFGGVQHPMYLELVPEAGSFVYLVSDGRKVWSEEYRRGEYESIYDSIHKFLQFLTLTGLDKLYFEHWKSKEQ